MFNAPAWFRGERAVTVHAPLALTAALLLGACSDQTGPLSGDARRAVVAAPGRFVPGRLMVGVTPGADPAAIAASIGARPVRQLLLRDIWMMSVPEGHELEIAAGLAHHAGVRFAEPDYIRVFGDILCSTCQIPNDDFFEWKWDLHNDGDVAVAPPFFVIPTGKVDADIDWLEAHEQLKTATFGPARIGIVDSGVRATHEDLCGKVVAGHDFANNDDDADDDHGHGTHVAGIAAACADNTVGVAGVAYPATVSIVVAKVCLADGSCTSSAVVDGIKWVVDQGADVVNLSLGGPDLSSSEQEALQYALANGALPVCAAGNEGNATVLYPAAFPECLAVSSTNNGDALASYSSYGPAVDVAAPGGDVDDILFGTSFIMSTFNGFDADYNLLVGTSMAAPQVTGLAALLHALQPGATPTQIRTRIEQTVDDLGAAGKDNQFGYGRINVYNAINNFTAPPPGNAPPAASFTASCAGMSCSFDGSSSSDSDGTIAGYAWEFGDGTSGAGVSIAHSYSASGSYGVKLTVTDDDGATGSYTRTVAVGITLSATGRKSRGKKLADLSWSGATGANVNVLRDGSTVATTANDGAYTDTITAKGGGTFRYRICETGTSNCSNEAVVTF